MTPLDTTPESPTQPNMTRRPPSPRHTKRRPPPSPTARRHQTHSAELASHMAQPHYTPPKSPPDAQKNTLPPIPTAQAAGPCRFRLLKWDRGRTRAVAICPMRCALRIGVDRGRLGGDVCRCAVGIGVGCVVSDALCCWDWWRARRFGRAWCRCAGGIGGRRVVWG